jgi:hypothetical protein
MKKLNGTAQETEIRRLGRAVYPRSRCITVNGEEMALHLERE